MIFVVDQRRGALIALNSLDEGAPFSWLLADPVTVGSMAKPGGIALNGDGQLIVADRDNNRVLVFDPDTGASDALDSSASNIGPLRQPAGVAVTATGQFIVADTGNHRIVFAESQDASEWSAYGTPGGTVPGGFEAPTGVYVDIAGRILVADPGADRLIRFDVPDGSGWMELALPPGLKKARPYALAAGPDGGILVTDLANSRILLLATDDSVTVIIDGLGDRSLIAPVALSMLNGDIVVADAAAACITRWILDIDSGLWAVTDRLDGRGGIKGGTEFSSISGLTTKEQL